MPRTISLVSDASRQASSPMPARELFTSEWFRKASTYAECVSETWFILSIEYGLLQPETVVSPYRRTRKVPPVEQRRAWADRVLTQLRRIVEPGDEVVFLAGERQREFLVGPIRELGCEVVVPMDGLTLGRQLRWLAEAAGASSSCDRPQGTGAGPVAVR